MHRPRLALGLSCNEYCLADLVYKLATNPKAPVFGWCSASQPNLGKALGVSRQSINTMIKKLVSKAILIKSQNGKLLKTGDIWAEVVVSYNFKDDRNSQESLHAVKKVDSQESLQPVKNLDTEQSRKLTANSQESLHNNNIDNDTLKSIDNDTSAHHQDNIENPLKDQKKQSVSKKEKVAPKRKKFVPPTLQEVRDYCKEQNVKLSFAEEFIDYNTNRDWKVGKNKMKDWKAAFRTSMRKDWNQKYKLNGSSNGKKFTHENYAKYL